MEIDLYCQTYLYSHIVQLVLWQRETHSSVPPPRKHLFPKLLPQSVSLGLYLSNLRSTHPYHARTCPTRSSVALTKVDHVLSTPRPLQRRSWLPVGPPRGAVVDRRCREIDGRIDPLSLERSPPPASRNGWIPAPTSTAPLNVTGRWLTVERAHQLPCQTQSQSEQ